LGCIFDAKPGHGCFCSGYGGLENLLVGSMSAASAAEERGVAMWKPQGDDESP
jgi:hypothetical protein